MLDLMAGQRAWALSWRILYEFLRVVTHRKAEHPMAISAALTNIDHFLASPTLTVVVPTQEHQALLRLTCEELESPSGNLLFDIEAAVLMREHGIEEIATLDGDFHRFRFLKVINPLQS